MNMPGQHCLRCDRELAFNFQREDQFEVDKAGVRVPKATVEKPLETLSSSKYWA